MKIALYDTHYRECPVTFDYYVWITYIKALGYEHVNFNVDSPRLKKYPGGLKEVCERFRTIIWPGPLFASMSRNYGKTGDRVGNCMIPELIKLGLGDQIPRLKTLKPAYNYRYTVTLRHMENKSERNSDRETWLEFAKRINAFVVEDYFDKPISLIDRAALYAGARMNFGVMTGPMAFLLWTKFPFCTFCPPIPSLLKSMLSHGIKQGEQWPFQLPNQKLIWKEATLENLLRVFDEVH